MRSRFILPLLLLGAGGNVSIATAQSAGTFTATGSMTTPREFHTATLLTNGKVLIAGGFSGNGPFSSRSSAEVYDPSTATFTTTGDMTTPRYMHTATLLPNGKVLIAGGQFQNDGPGQASAELYDPATGTFSATGSMTTPRSIQTATLLNNGKVLIAGGTYPYSQTAEIYDPSTGTFTATGDMTEPGADTATLLPNGKVLVTRSVQYFEENHADLYDPATDMFTRTGDIIDYSTQGQYPPAIPGQDPTTMLLTNGTVLIAGGAQGDFYSSGAEIYDPAVGAFSSTGRMTAGIGYWQAAALLPEGKVLISGESSGASAGIAELYDPVAGTFGTPFDSQSEEGHAATLLPDGTVLLSGGWFLCGATPIGIALPGCGGTLASTQIYHPGVLVPAPLLFSLAEDGLGQGAIWNGVTGQIASPSNQATAGDVLATYTSSLFEGGVIPPQVAVGGRLAEILYFGDAPGYPGYFQVNFRVPAGVAPGPAVSVRLTYIGRPSNAVTIGVQSSLNEGNPEP
jgi:hypothetical protein